MPPGPMLFYLDDVLVSFLNEECSCAAKGSMPRLHFTVNDLRHAAVPA